MLTSMPKFKLREEDLLNMCETVELCKEEDSDYDDILPWSNCSNFSDHESSHTVRPINELCQE